MSQVKKIKADHSLIRQHILENPEIVTSDPDVLIALGKHFKQEFGENVIDLRDMAIKKAEKELNAMHERTKTFRHILTENYDGAIRIINFLSLLVEAEDHDHLFFLMLTKAPQTLDVDYLRFIQITGKSLPPPLVDTRNQTIKNMTQGKFSKFLGKDTAELYDNKIVLRSVVMGDPNVYGNVADDIQSEAIIDLSLDSHFDYTLTFLVLASTQPFKFEDGMETDLLEKLGIAFVRIVQSLLKK